MAPSPGGQASARSALFALGDESLAATLAAEAGSIGLDVELCTSHEQLLLRVEQVQPALVVLSHGLDTTHGPAAEAGDGLSLYHQVRDRMRHTLGPAGHAHDHSGGHPAVSGTGVVLMIISREVKDEVVGALETGYDDFILHPVNPGSFGSRVSMIMQAAMESAVPSGNIGRIRHGGLAVDLARHRAYCDGDEVTLPSTLFGLLVTMMQNADTVWRREELLFKLRGSGAGDHARTADFHIHRLRQALGPCGAMVQTVHGVGYRLRRARADL